MPQYREQSQIVGVHQIPHYVATAELGLHLAQVGPSRGHNGTQCGDALTRRRQCGFYDCTEKLTSPPMATAPAAMIDSNHCHRPLPLPVAVIICHIYSL
jgi:hypothetical protein